MEENQNDNEMDDLTCLGIWRCARELSNPDVEQSAHQYIMRNFMEISKTSDELLELSLEEVILLLSNDELNVRDEEVVWEATLRWISHDEAARKTHIADLLKTVRTGLMTTPNFMEKVKDNRLTKEHEGCASIINETLRYLLFLNRAREVRVQIESSVMSIARPRIPHSIIFVIGGWSGGTPSNIIETYDPKAKKWLGLGSDKVDQIGPRAYHGLVVIGFKIYIIGGFNGTDYFNSGLVFNAAATGRWEDIAPMTEARCYVSVAALDRKIYAMGGYNGKERLASCERFDSATNKWTTISPMHFNRSDADATTLHNLIYVCGGFNGIESLRSCESYNPETDQWTMLAPLLTARSGVSCVGYNGQIYAVGGFNGLTRLSSGEAFDPQTKTWLSIPDMKTPRSNFAIEVIDDFLICIGGFIGTATTSKVEAYYHKSNEWQDCTHMSIYRSALAACVVSGLPNVRDYIPLRPKAIHATAGSTTINNNDGETDNDEIDDEL